MQVAILMGSDNDWSIVKSICEVFQKFGVSFEAHVLSAHRSPVDLLNYVKHCEEIGCHIFICVAGKAAHLAGVVASHTIFPVIGVPVSGDVSFDSLLSTVQMPPGVPVATVAVDGGTNAALLAIQMLSLSDKDLMGQLQEYRASLRQVAIDKDKRVQEWIADISAPN